MADDQKILGLATMEKLIKKSGGSRVSEDAKETLRDHLEAAADELCKKAAKFASHAGRKTIKAEDIRLALK